MLRKELRSYKGRKRRQFLAISLGLLMVVSVFQSITYGQEEIKSYPGMGFEFRDLFEFDSGGSVNIVIGGDITINKNLTMGGVYVECEQKVAGESDYIPDDYMIACLLTKLKEETEHTLFVGSYNWFYQALFDQLKVYWNRGDFDQMQEKAEKTIRVFKAVLTKIIEDNKRDKYEAFNGKTEEALQGLETISEKINTHLAPYTKDAMIKSLRTSLEMWKERVRELIGDINEHDNIDESLSISQKLFLARNKVQGAYRQIQEFKSQLQEIGISGDNNIQNHFNKIKSILSEVLKGSGEGEAGSNATKPLDLSEELAKLQKRLQEQEKLIKTQKEQITKLLERIAHLRTQFQNLLKNYQKLRERVKATIGEAQQVLEKQEEQLKQLQSHFQKAQGILGQIFKVSSPDNSSNTSSNVSSDFSQHLQNLDQLQKYIEELEREIIRLEAENKRLLSELQKINSAFEKYREQVKEIIEETEKALGQQEEKVKQLEIELQQHQGALANIGITDSQQLQEKISQIKTILDQILQDEESNELGIGGIEQKLERLQKEREAQARKIAEQAKVLEEHQLLIGQYNDDITKLKKHISFLEQQIKDVNDRYQSYQELTKEVIREVEQVLDQQEQVREKGIQEKTQELAKKDSIISQQQETIKQIGEKLQLNIGNSSNIQSIFDRINSLLGEVTETQEELRLVSGNLQQQVQENTRLQEQITNQEQTIDGQKQQLSQQETKLSSLQQEITQLKETISQQTQTIKEQGQELERQKSQLQKQHEVIKGIDQTLHTTISSENKVQLIFQRINQILGGVEGVQVPEKTVSPEQEDKVKSTQEVTSLKEQIAQQAQKILEQERIIKEQQEGKGQTSQETAQLQSQIINLQQQLQKQQEVIKKQEQQTQELISALKQKNDSRDTKTSEDVEALQKTITDLRQEIHDLQKQLQEAQNVSSLSSDEKERLIGELQRKITEQAQKIQAQEEVLKAQESHKATSQQNQDALIAQQHQIISQQTAQIALLQAQLQQQSAPQVIYQLRSETTTTPLPKTEDGEEKDQLITELKEQVTKLRVENQEKDQKIEQLETSNDQLQQQNHIKEQDLELLRIQKVQLVEKNQKIQLLAYGAMFMSIPPILRYLVYLLAIKKKGRKLFINFLKEK